MISSFSCVSFADNQMVESKTTGFDSHVIVVPNDPSIITPLYDSEISSYLVLKAPGYTQVGQSRFTLLPAENAVGLQVGNVTDNIPIFFNILDETTQPPQYVNPNGFMGPVYPNMVIYYSGLNPDHQYTFRVNTGAFPASTAELRIFTVTYP